MKLVELDLSMIQIGEPLPFSLRDEQGVLLAKKGFVIKSKSDLKDLVEGGVGLFVAEAENVRRSYVNRLRSMIGSDQALGQIANTQITSKDIPEDEEEEDGLPDWLDLQVQTNSLLRDNTSPFFVEKLDKILGKLSRLTRHNPDGTLFALFNLSSNETGLYGATHALLVSSICSIAAREVLRWPSEVEQTLMRAALTMNIGMIELQDRLVRQVPPPTPEQREQIKHHATRSVQILKQLGITDAVWLDTVLEHHSATSGPLASKTPAQRLARLIARTDMFAARLSPRASRTPVAPATAMQACYFDENRKVDEAGAALIKAVGIYSPGSFVRLNTNEIAVVVRRGANTTAPRVAVLINRSGMPTVEPIIRDTGLHEYRIVASVPHREVKLKLSLQRMLPLTVGPGMDRAW